jgi:hypothetical protein
VEQRLREVDSCTRHRAAHEALRGEDTDCVLAGQLYHNFNSAVSRLESLETDPFLGLVLSHVSLGMVSAEVQPS